MKIDHQKPANVEVLLGCLDCTVQLSALKGFACNPILRELAEAIGRELLAIGAQIGELKMSLAPEIGVDGVATLSVRGSHTSVSAELDEPVERGVLNLTLHAGAKADHLAAAVTQALTHTWDVFPEVFARLAKMEHFQAGATPASEPPANG